MAQKDVRYAGQTIFCMKDLYKPFLIREKDSLVKIAGNGSVPVKLFLSQDGEKRNGCII